MTKALYNCFIIIFLSYILHMISPLKHVVTIAVVINQHETDHENFLFKYAFVKFIVKNILIFHTSNKTLSII